MKGGEKKAVGIDITQDRVNIVLLKSGKSGVELLKSASVNMPQGAVKDGNIADVELFTKVLRDLKRQSGIRAKRAAVTLFARPAVVHIFDMPKQVPTNIRQFVTNEIKNCVVLPSRDVTFDFCGIGSVKRAADKRVLAVAAETEKLLNLVRICGRAGFKIETIEPALPAYLRAIHAQKITGKTASNVLVAMLRSTTLILCVLKNGTLDFIRIKEIAVAKDGLGRRLADEISEVVRFYDIEAGENSGKWEITVFADTFQLPRSAEEQIKTLVKAEHLQVRTIEDAYKDTPFGISAAKTTDAPASPEPLASRGGPSPVAAGLAMNLLTDSSSYLRTNPLQTSGINLLPPMVLQTREAKRDALIAVNAVAAVVLLMVLAVNIFSLLITRANRGAMAKEPLFDKENTSLLLKEQEKLDSRLGALTIRLNGIEQIRAAHKDVNWVQVFDEIRRASSSSVRISAVVCQDGSQMLVQGLALTNDAVYAFINSLEKSPCIASVTLLETREQNSQNGIITYQLNCKLNIKSREADDVG
jgi:Tfp pilus assembly protein PilN